MACLISTNQWSLQNGWKNSALSIFSHKNWHPTQTHFYHCKSHLPSPSIRHNLYLHYPHILVSIHLPSLLSRLLSTHNQLQKRGHTKLTFFNVVTKQSRDFRKRHNVIKTNCFKNSNDTVGTWTYYRVDSEGNRKNTLYFQVHPFVE